MANEKNLKPIRKGQLSKEEAKRRGSNGGKKSAEVRKARKTFSEDLLEALSDGKTQEQILKSLLNQCKQGNVRAFEILRDTIGEKPIDRQEVKEITSEWFK
jgi:hypothetical protein